MPNIELTRIGGRRPAAASGLVAAAAGPASLVAGSDLLMVVAVVAFSACAVLGRADGHAGLASAFVAASAAVCLVCVPAADGALSFAMAGAFSLSCVALAALTPRANRAASPAAAA